LCWIDVEPKTEGLSDDIAQVRAKAVLIQSMDGQIAISGIDDGTRIYAYEVSGQQVGSAISHNGQANLTTNLKPGSIVIIKIGDRSVKATVK
jgi:aspartate 1-decarboxylase